MKAPFSIGLRFYRIALQPDGAKGDVPFSNDGTSRDVLNFLKSFVGARLKPEHNSVSLKSWHFQPVGVNNTRVVAGRVMYGTAGFQSRLIDAKTAKTSYTRKVTDIEEIPLFFKFWIPDPSNFGIAVFQSFQTRSCITAITFDLSKSYHEAHGSHRLHFKKLMPAEMKGTVLSSAPVKELKYLSRNVSSDSADRYLAGAAPSEVNIRLSIEAKRSGSLGPLSKFFSNRKQLAAGLMQHDGIEFGEVQAEIEVGKRRRTVALFGVNSDAGAVDVSNDVKFGSDGHPTFESIYKESMAIEKDIHKILDGST